MQPVSFHFAKDKQEAKTSALGMATLTFQIVKHHQSFHAASCISKVNAKIFDDSTTAYKFGSCNTKTEAIVCNVLAPYTLDTVKKNLESVFFVGLSTHASNHKYHKLFPIAVEYIDVD